MFNLFSNRESQIFGIASCVLFAGAFMFTAVAFEAMYWTQIQVAFPGFVEAIPLMWFAQFLYVITSAALGVVSVLVLSWFGQLFIEAIKFMFLYVAFRRISIPDILNKQKK